jgi:hypothetical protein
MPKLPPIDITKTSRHDECVATGGHRIGNYPVPPEDKQTFDAVIWEKATQCKRCKSIWVTKWRYRE